jgi:hypothetical protein
MVAVAADGLGIVDLVEGVPYLACSVVTEADNLVW